MVEMVDCCDLCVDTLVDGAVNFRDLGGYATRAGQVRRGLLFRSGMTHFISDAGWRTLADVYGLRTVIELRTPVERREDGLAPYETYGISHEHVPVLADAGASMTEVVRRFAGMHGGDYEWTAAYARMLEQGGPAFRRVFEVMVAEEALPAVFHCTGGRDRTGVMAALLLAVPGADDDAIALDYALTGLHLRRHVDCFTGPARRMEMSREEMAQLLETREEAMLGFLALIRERYGSAEGYLAGIGVGNELLAELRVRLVT